MGNRSQPSKLVTIAELPTAGNPPIRVRLTGRVIAVDGLRSLVTLQDEQVGLNVNVGAAVGSEDGFLPKLKDLVMVTGHLVVMPAGLVAPRVGVSGPEPAMWTDRMVEAVLIKRCEELDQHAWRESIRLLSAA